MLYVTTRGTQESFTSVRTLGEACGPDGGCFLPVVFPIYHEDEILAFGEKSFSQCIAEVLNGFFSARLDERDVDFCVGRFPLRLIPMSHRILVAEPWHNPDWSVSRMVRNLTSRMRGTQYQAALPPAWARIAVGVGVIFGIFGQLLQQRSMDWDWPMDLSVSMGDFTTPMAAYYAKKMGLPIGRIIVGCNVNGGLWELTHRGEMKTNVLAEKTNTPKGDCACPPDLERLIYDCLGSGEAQRFGEAYRTGEVYSLKQEQADVLHQAMYTAVISDRRVESVIASVYTGSTYLLSPYSALAYAGLLDYRATGGSGRTALLLTEESPICCADTVCGAMGISNAELRERLNLK